MNKTIILNESKGTKNNLLNSELKDPVFKLLHTEAVGSEQCQVNTGTHYFCRGQYRIVQFAVDL